MTLTSNSTLPNKNSTFREEISSIFIQILKTVQVFLVVITLKVFKNS
jgi:hypothetical protein